MPPDLDTKAVLTLIALCFIVLALGSLSAHLAPPDLDTKAGLTLIALCFIVLALGSLSAHLAPPARAAQLLALAGITAGATLSCRVPGNGCERCLPVSIGQ